MFHFPFIFACCERKIEAVERWTGILRSTWKKHTNKKSVCIFFQVKTKRGDSRDGRRSESSFGSVCLRFCDHNSDFWCLSTIARELDENLKNEEPPLVRLWGCTTQTSTPPRKKKSSQSSALTKSIWHQALSLSWHSLEPPPSNDQVIPEVWHFCHKLDIKLVA
jgi:hypothetical protein